jgi:hypothetical protein
LQKIRSAASAVILTALRVSVKTLFIGTLRLSPMAKQSLRCLYAQYADTSIVLTRKPHFLDRILGRFPPRDRHTVEVPEASEFTVHCHMAASLLLPLALVALEVKGPNV